MAAEKLVDVLLKIMSVKREPTNFVVRLLLLLLVVDDVVFLRVAVGNVVESKGGSQ